MSGNDRSTGPAEVVPASTTPQDQTAREICFSDDRGAGRSLWPEPWASQTTVQADSIGRQARLALGDSPSPAQLRTLAAINHLLQHAKEASARRSWWQRPLDRWRGTSLERAHTNLHAAQVLLVDLLSEDDVDALIPSAVHRVTSSLKRRDIRRIQAEEMLSPPTEPSPSSAAQNARKRARLKRALQLGYDALDQQHARIRNFRNLLFVVSAILTLFMAVLVVVVSRHPESMPLCFEPSVTVSSANDVAPSSSSAATVPTPSASAKTASPAPQSVPTETTQSRERRVCPSGADPAPGVGNPRMPSPPDVWIVAGLGLLGGAVAAAFAIRKVRGTSTPYDVPLALAVLKVPTGALTAVVGIVILGGGFVPGLSELDSQRQILAYALLFGYAQQLATRFIDNRAQDLLDGVPSKDPKGKHGKPTPPPSSTGSGPPPSANTTAPTATPPTGGSGGATTTAPPEGSGLGSETANPGLPTPLAEPPPAKVRSRRIATRGPLWKGRRTG